MTKRLGSEQWDERCGGSELLWTAWPNRFLVSELEAHATHDRALDLACGEGRNGVWLGRAGESSDLQVLREPI
jgi:ubiquinone/menaquinone biosynthesis C-methylase UbiE